jgi:hypothetical protein
MFEGVRAIAIAPPSGGAVEEIEDAMAFLEH